jgi:ATPase subunit of ABC transporter with duplicated ATPase domains
MARQFIYHMSGLNKSYGAKKILENVNLSFYPDAKIGMLGPNGAGKSTLLQDHGRPGQGIHRRGLGRARCSRRLSRAGTAARSFEDRENVMLGVAKQEAVLERYNELMMNYSDETADEGAKLQDEIEANLWDLEQQVDHGDGSAALPAEGCRRHQAVGW